MHCSSFWPILTIIALVSLVKCDFSSYQTIDDFLAMIIGNITESDNYVLPTNNSEMLNVSDSNLYEYGTFDFIIIGSGSSGAVLANRLSEVEQWNVLLLEAGGEDNDFSDIPEMATYLQNSRMNWGYQTTPQKHIGLDENLQPQSLDYPRGKVIGGTSTINGLVYSRGNPEDFDSWQMPGWSYEEVLPYFIKSEDAKFQPRDQEYHGEGGYLSVDVVSETPTLGPAVISAFQEMGFNYSDYNGKNQVGIGKAQYNHKYNQRASSSRAFLDPIKNRNNLNISLNSFVTKLLINKYTKSTYGVEFVKNGKRYFANAKHEVVLSAGAINTPQILMLSGIGPREHLKELGIQLLQDLPVGESLVDQVVYSSMMYRTNHVFFNITYKEQVENYLENVRPLTGWGELLGFVKLDNSSSQNRPDFEAIITVTAPTYEEYVNSTSYSESFNFFHDIVMALVPMRPVSRGTLKLKSNSPLDMPLMDPNYLGDENGQDLETLYQTMQFILSLNDTESFQMYNAHFYHVPIEPCDTNFSRYTREWIYCAIKRAAAPGWHVVASTPMGNSSKNSVVDAKLKVHGVRNLRIVDAGVMPDMVSGHPSAPAIMIGEKAADLIKEEYNMPESGIKIEKHNDDASKGIPSKEWSYLVYQNNIETWSAKETNEESE